ncbi:DUF1120 domain-containing protein [Enterobacter asburiae]|uniref:DUF1120 domain-containing protein n=1 Tax=Enterobacter asburiae TaxID=61645 RepID=UPI001C212839|nr:DUF1120 domain-containing protein [Enterobacter asburiae]QXB77853.1 DUF1120 domain-containing protein [Enterobacter asburiae]
MKKEMIGKVLVSALLVSATFSAFAAETVDLKVKGVLGNTACTPTLSNDGTADFGRIKMSGLSATDVNQLGKKEITLTITCDAAMAVGVSAMDARSSSRQAIMITQGTSNNVNIADGAWEFGLGMTEGGVKLGAYTITAATTDGSGVTLDGVAADTIVSKKAGASTTSTGWRKVAAISTGFKPDDTEVWSFAEAGTLVPKAFKVAVLPLRVNAAIQNTTTLAITDDTNLDGLTTLSLVYL